MDREVTDKPVTTPERAFDPPRCWHHSGPCRFDQGHKGPHNWQTATGDARLLRKALEAAIGPVDDCYLATHAAHHDPQYADVLVTRIASDAAAQPTGADLPVDAGERLQPCAICHDDFDDPEDLNTIGAQASRPIRPWIHAYHLTESPPATPEPVRGAQSQGVERRSCGCPTGPQGVWEPHRLIDSSEPDIDQLQQDGAQE